MNFRNVLLLTKTGLNGRNFDLYPNSVDCTRPRVVGLIPSHGVERSWTVYLPYFILILTAILLLFSCRWPAPQGTAVPARPPPQATVQNRITGPIRRQPGTTNSRIILTRSRHRSSSLLLPGSLITSGSTSLSNPSSTLPVPSTAELRCFGTACPAPSAS